MHWHYLFFISALLVVDVRCDCDHYIDCFTAFLSEIFEKNTTDTKDGVEKTVPRTVELDENDDLDKVFLNVVGLIKEISADIKESETVKKEYNKTKVYVKAFEFNKLPVEVITEGTTVDDVIETTTASDVVETTTDTKEVTDILMEDATNPSKATDSFSVIPLKSNKENEIRTKDYFLDIYNDLNDDNSTDYLGIDYLDLYKDTTNEYVEYKPTEPTIKTTEPTIKPADSSLEEEIRHNDKDIDNIIEHSLKVLTDLIQNGSIDAVRSCNGDSMALSSAVFPWVATIFVKNESKGDQFDYFCDGALLSDRVILTSARCTYNGSHFVSADHFIVILGKTSLQVTRGDENILRVQEVKRHENFAISNGKSENNLALLVLEDLVPFSDGINKACFKNDNESATDDDEESKEAVTTAWSLSGDLTLIYFDKEKSKACGSDNKVENTFCATYGNDVALCPSYGGLYVSKTSVGQVYLHGLRTGNPLERGICYSKDVTYTSLNNYTQWIDDNINVKEIN